MLAAVLALSASVGWGTANFLAGLAGRRLALAAVLLVSQLAGLLLLGVVVSVRGEGPPPARYLLYSMLTGLVAAVAIAALYRSLAVGSMSIVAPITATGAVIPVAVGLARGENLSGLQGSGIGLALAGVVMAAREPGAENVRWHVASGAGTALVAAAAAGAALVGIDAASEGDPLWAVLVLRATTTSLFVLAALVAQPGLPAAWRVAAMLTLLGLLDAAGLALFGAASTKGPLSFVTVLANMYPVVTVLLARLILRERVARTQQAGVAGALAGVGLIMTG